MSAHLDFGTLRYFQDFNDVPDDDGLYRVFVGLGGGSNVAPPVGYQVTIGDSEVSCQAIVKSVTQHGDWICLAVEADHGTFREAPTFDFGAGS